MLRILARLIGLMALAGAFAALIVDGTRTIAGSAISITPLSQLMQAKLPAWQAAAAKLNPLLADPVLKDTVALPIWVALAIVGLLLMWIARRRPSPIGTLARS